MVLDLLSQRLQVPLCVMLRRFVGIVNAAHVQGEFSFPEFVLLSLLPHCFSLLWFEALKRIVEATSPALGRATERVLRAVEILGLFEGRFGVRLYDSGRSEVDLSACLSFEGRHDCFSRFSFIRIKKYY